jgi:hypothetical protein
MESTPKSTPCTITMMYFGASADESAGSENFTWEKHYEKVIYSVYEKWSILCFYDNL